MIISTCSQQKKESMKYFRILFIVSFWNWVCLLHLLCISILTSHSSGAPQHSVAGGLQSNFGESYSQFFLASNIPPQRAFPAVLSKVPFNHHLVAFSSQTLMLLEIILFVYTCLVTFLHPESSLKAAILSFSFKGAIHEWRNKWTNEHVILP